MITKIDIRDIIRDHFATLTDNESGRRSIADQFLFFGVPVLGSGALLVLEICPSDTAVNVLITSLSIFAGLLFNLLVLIAGLADRRSAPTGEADSRLMMRSIYSNIAYALLVSLVTLVPLGFYAMTVDATVRTVLAGVAYFLLGHFMLTLLMVLKRMHALLSHEFSRPRTP